MGIAVPLLKASVIAALVFAAAWIRIPVSASNLDSVVRDFVGFGLLIVILSLTVGYVLAFIAVKLRIVRWWSSVAVAAAVGALLGGLCTYKRSPAPNTVEIENPFAWAFSPWNRDNPGFIRGAPCLTLTSWDRSRFSGSLAPCSDSRSGTSTRAHAPLVCRPRRPSNVISTRHVQACAMSAE